jgi:F-type H+-transporting ATPase subunit delta
MSDNGQADLELTGDVQSARIARVYAEALLNSAARQGQESAVLDELDSLVRDLFTALPSFEAFLSSGAVGRDRKEPIIQKTFENRAGELFTNFLLVLNNHERLDILRPILAAAHQLYDERHGRLRVHVRTAVPLTSAQSQRLREELQRAFEREPILEASVEPELLGGMLVRVGDWLYDASVRAQLDTIRSQLIERSSYEIQSGRDRFRSTNGD